MKKELVQDHLLLLSRLALEYRQKSDELEAFIQDADPKTVFHQLELRAELTTDRFRTAQQTLLQSLSSDSSHFPDELMHQAALALCRCFDEMRILFHAMADEAGRSRS